MDQILYLPLSLGGGKLFRATSPKSAYHSIRLARRQSINMMTELDNYDAKCYDHPLLEELSGKEREQFEEALQGFEEIMHLFAQLREAQGGDPETSTFAPPLENSP